MSGETSRQRRKAAIAALPTITSHELIELGLMNLEFEILVPQWLEDRADDVTLMQMVDAVRYRRAAWLDSLLKIGHAPLSED